MTEKRIWVIGGANIDIIGSATHPLKEFDSNIGHIKESFGGVGRNIAQACAELGERVSLVTCFGDDEYGSIIEKNCAQIGIDTSYSIKSHKHPTSLYIAILDENRDMRIAMNDMSILEELDAETLKRAIDNMSSDDILVIDSNLDPSYIEYIVDKSPARIASDPVSAAKVMRLKSVLGKISIFKPNAIEAEALTGLKIVDDRTAKASLEWFLERGIDEVLITLGTKGILCGTEERLWHTTHRVVDMDSANGGGDAMFGAYLSRRLRGEDVRNSLEFSIAAAIYKISGAGISRVEARLDDGCQSHNDVDDNLIDKEKAIMKLIETLEIKEKEL